MGWIGSVAWWVDWERSRWGCHGFPVRPTTLRVILGGPVRGERVYGDGVLHLKPPEQEVPVEVFLDGVWVPGVLWAWQKDWADRWCGWVRGEGLPERGWPVDLIRRRDGDGEDGVATTPRRSRNANC